MSVLVLPGLQLWGSYKHSDLTKHFKRYHPGKTWIFVCHVCGRGKNNLKKLKTHIERLHTPDEVPDNPRGTPLPHELPVEPDEMSDRPLAEPATQLSAKAGNYCLNLHLNQGSGPQWVPGGAVTGRTTSS